MAPLAAVFAIVEYVEEHEAAHKSHDQRRERSDFRVAEEDPSNQKNASSKRKRDIEISCNYNH